MYIEGALMSKSRNIALTYIEFKKLYQVEIFDVHFQWWACLCQKEENRTATLTKLSGPQHGEVPLQMYMLPVSQVFWMTQAQVLITSFNSTIEEYSAKRGLSPIWFILRKMAKQDLVNIAGNGLQWP